jgi:isocitrate lyase
MGVTLLIKVLTPFLLLPLPLLLIHPPLFQPPFQQFVTLAGFHALNYSMFTLAHDYAKRGMAAYAELQADEFAAEKQGYTATRHQGFVGTGYFDDLAQVIAAGTASTTALTGSTEEEQF